MGQFCHHGFVALLRMYLACKKTPAVVKERDEGMNEPRIFCNLFKGP